MPDKKSLIVGFASAVTIFLILFFSGWYIAGDPVLHAAAVFSVAATDVANMYPFPIYGRRVFADAESGLFDKLDPFSFRMNRQEYADLIEESSGEYGGIGVTIVPRDTALMVMAVYEGGPGFQAGLRAGDLIIAVEGKPVFPSNPNEAVARIRGPVGSTVQLTLYRPSLADTISLRLTRRSIKLEHLMYAGMTESKAAYIRLADFEAGAAEDLAKAVDSLESENPTGYVIDLTGNPGGFLEESIAAAELFVPKGSLIVGTSGRSRWESRRYLSLASPITSRPVVILTDRGSASAAEIFTGALRGAGRAVVVGDTTFGKGLVQTVFSLSNQDAVRLTTSRYFFADGRYLNPPDSALTFVGLAPDMVFRDSGEIMFEGLILTGFLLYDFVERYDSLLSRYPSSFNYADTVVALFEQYAVSQGLRYRSRLTLICDLVLMQQKLDQADKAIITGLEKLRQVSEQDDREVYVREKEFVKFHIRRVMVERKFGQADAYRDVIVPGRADIRLAERILSDSTRYQAIVAAGDQLH